MNGKGLKQFLVIVRSTVHLRPSIQKSLLSPLLLLLLLLLLQKRDTSGFIVNRPIRFVVHVRVIEIREFRLEGLRKQKNVTNISKQDRLVSQTTQTFKRRPNLRTLLAHSSFSRDVNFSAINTSAILSRDNCVELYLPLRRIDASTTIEVRGRN